MSYAVAYSSMAESSGKIKPIDENLEKVLIITHVESVRKKGGFLDRTVENYSFILKVNWPFIFLKKTAENLYMPFDSLGIFSYQFQRNIPYNPLEAEKKIGKLSPQKDKVNKYIELLSQLVEHYNQFHQTKTITFQGLIVDPHLPAEILTNVIEYKPEEPILKMRVPLDKSSTALKNFLKLQKEIEKELQQLQKLIKTISTKTQSWIKALNKDLEKERKSFNLRYKKLERSVEKEIKQLEKMQGNELESINKSYENIIGRLNEWFKIWDKESSRYTYLGDKFKGLASESMKLRDELNNRIASIHHEREEILQNLKEYYSNAISRKRNELRSANTEFTFKEAELNMWISRLNTLTEELSIKISSLQESNSSISKWMDNFGFKLPAKKFEGALPKKIVLNIPIYVCKLESPKGARFLVYPPITIDVSSPPSPTFEKTKIPLRFLSPTFELLKSQLEASLTRDEALQNELSNLAASKSIFKDPENKEKIRAGLMEMISRGWIKPKQADELQRVIIPLFSTP